MDTVVRAQRGLLGNRAHAPASDERGFEWVRGGGWRGCRVLPGRAEAIVRGEATTGETKAVGGGRLELFSAAMCAQLESYRT